MGPDAASSQRAAAVLKAKQESSRPQKFSTGFVATDDLLLRKAGSEMIRQVLGASMAVQTYAADDICAAQCFTTLFGEKVFFPPFLNGNTFLPSVLTKKRGTCEDHSSAVRSNRHGSVACFPRYLICERLCRGSLPSREAALKKSEFDWGGCSAGNKGSECSAEVHWLRKLPDCLLALLPPQQ